MQTAYWTGITSPYANSIPAFTANILYNFNDDGRNNVNLYYDNVYQSENGVLDARTGVFTAKARGIYYFSFSGIKNIQDDVPSRKTLIEIMKNQREVVAATFCDGTGAGRNTVLPNFAHVTLSLEAGDTINAVLRFGKFYAQFQPSTALTGFLIVPFPTVGTSAIRINPL